MGQETEGQGAHWSSQDEDGPEDTTGGGWWGILLLASRGEGGSVDTCVWEGSRGGFPALPLRTVLQGHSNKFTTDNNEECCFTPLVSEWWNLLPADMEGGSTLGY